MKTLRSTLLIGFLALPAVGLAQRVIGTPTMPGGSTGALYTVLGQPTTGDTTTGSRCGSSNANFNYNPNSDDAGPAGIAIDPRGRFYVTDYAGHRVLSWPDSDGLVPCLGADAVIDAAGLIGPEAVAFPPADEEEEK